MARGSEWWVSHPSCVTRTSGLQARTSGGTSAWNAASHPASSVNGGSGGSYGEEDVFARPYRNRDDARAYLKKGTKFGPRQVEYVKEICNYIYDTYGRFPAHVDAFYAPGMWLQFSHLEMEYYDRFFDPAQYTRQKAHDDLWHPK